MKLKLHHSYILYLVAILTTACSPTYNLQSYEHKVEEVKTVADSNILSIIKPYQDEIEEEMNEVLCVSEMLMTKKGSQSLLGNFVTDLCLKQFPDKADICIMNNGGLRTSLPKGDITRGKIYELMPFENELVILELKQEDFKGLLKYIISRGGEPFSGMELKTNNKGELISYTFLNTINFEKGEIVKVLTSDYLANGGDKMWFFQNKEQEQVGLKLRDAIINHCINLDSITSQIDNRLIQTTE